MISAFQLPGLLALGKQRLMDITDRHTHTQREREREKTEEEENTEEENEQGELHRSRWHKL
jgi:hypothetical protein